MKRLLIISTLLTCSTITPSHSISTLPLMIEDRIPNRSNSTTEDESLIQSLQTRVDELEKGLDLLFKENNKTTAQAWLKHALKDLDEKKAELKSKTDEISKIAQKLKTEKHGLKRYWADAKCFTLGASMATAGYVVFTYLFLPPGKGTITWSFKS